MRAGGPRTQGGRTPQLTISLIGEERRQPFARTLVAFGLLRREKSEKRGVRWKRLTLKIRLPCDEDQGNRIMKILGK